MKHVQCVCLLLLSMGLALPVQASTARSRALHDLQRLALGYSLADEYSSEPRHSIWNAPETPVRDDKRAAQLDEALPQIVRGISQRCKSDNTDLNFFLAGLWEEKSRYVRAVQEEPAFEESAQKWRECRSKGDATVCGPQPRPSYESSDRYRQAAMDLYDTLIHHYPKYPRNDEVRFRLGLLHLSLSAHGELGAERRKHHEEAMALFRSVAELSPTSAVASDALVSLGDEYLVGNRLMPSCDAYAQAAKLNAPSSGLYAKFMVGWCDSNRGDETARARLQEVVTLASQATGKNATLKDRALSALVDTYAAQEQFEEAKDYYSKTVGEQNAGKYLTSIARLSLVNGRYPFALRAFRQLLQDAPDDARAPTWQAGVVVALDQCGSDTETTEAAKELVKRFGEGSVWRERMQGNQEAVDRANEVVTTAKVVAEWAAPEQGREVKRTPAKDSRKSRAGSR